MIYTASLISISSLFISNLSTLQLLSIATLQRHTDIRTRKKIKMRVELYNMIPNLLWSIINLLPIGWFCYIFLPRKLLYVFLGISFIGYLLPESFYNAIQVKNLKFLKRTGVSFAQRFAQNGVIINRIIRRKFPGYKTIYDKRTLDARYKKTYEFEKFHFVALLFFLFTTIFALLQSYYFWALILFITNVVYNIYPILLQHYTRLRITSLLSRKYS